MGNLALSPCFRIWARRANFSVYKFTDSDIPRAKAPRTPSSEIYFCFFAAPSTSLRTCFASLREIILILVALRHARSFVVHTSSQETQNNPKIKGVERKDLRDVQAGFCICEDLGRDYPRAVRRVNHTFLYLYPRDT